MALSNQFVYKCFYFWWRLYSSSNGSPLFCCKKTLFQRRRFSQYGCCSTINAQSHCNQSFGFGWIQSSWYCGASISCIAAVIPPLVILAAVSAFYKVFISNTIIVAVLKGMEAGVAALMVDLIIDMCSLILKKKSLLLSAMIPLSFIANFILGINVALILLFCCLICIFQVLCNRGKTK